MPVSTLTSKGQMTIPKEVRNALNLKPSEKVIIVAEGDHAVIRPLREIPSILGVQLGYPIRKSL